MSDDLHDLKAALQAAPPAPDAEARARNIALAMENFDRHQETTAQARSKSDRPSEAGVLTGVRAMLTKLTSRRALAATTSVAAICIGVFVMVPAAQKDGLTQAPKPVKVEAPKITGAAPSVSAATAEEAAPEATPEADAPATDAPIVTADEVPAPEATPIEQPDNAPEAEAGDLAMAVEAQRVTEAEEAAPQAPAASFGPTGGLSLSGEGRMGIVSDGEAGEFSSRARVRLSPSGETDGGLTYGGTFGEAYPLLPLPNTETFANEAPSAIKTTAEEPVSTFSIDVDTASYALVRSSLMAGYLPTPEAVRIEEMINYFPYGYAAPEAGEAPFRPTVSVVPAPWNTGKQLVHIAIQGRQPALEDRPPLNLVFLIDTSGSMQDANKLPLLKQSFRLMLGQLRPEDQVAIVAYAGSSGQVLEATPASESAKIMAALDRLDAGGGTAGQEGLQQAYMVAEDMAAEGEVTRVILATDGDFNIGISNPDQLKTFIEGKRKSGTYLSVLGFGRGNIDDAVMQSLAQNGNGTASYIDTLSEAQKVLVDQLSGALFPIANDVKIQMEFNPAVIAEYRLIGYETRALAREDFNNDKVDAGDIGAGHTVTAIYEVTPVGSPALQNDPLRYSTAEAEPVIVVNDLELGYLKLRYKEPGSATSVLIDMPITRPDAGAMSEDVRFGVAMAGFGQLLTGAEYLGDWGWDEAIALANSAKGADEFGYRAEAIKMMRLAQSLQR